MNVIKIILIIVMAIIAIPLIAALFIKRGYTVEREIVINRPRQQVFDFIKMLKNQDQYNKWWTMDPNVKKDFRGTDGTVGFVAAWDSENKQAGKGEQEIKTVVEGQLLDCELRFIKPFENTARTIMTTESVSSNQTRVKWVFTGTNKYPMNIMNLGMNKILGNDLEISITRLKEAVEKL